MSQDLSVNQMAWKLFEELVRNSAFYGVKVEKDSGITIVDAGVNTKGGFQAGKLVTEICMGGCAKVEITRKKYGGLELPSILVQTDHPIVATLGSQYAGWQINEDGYFAIGSGPARALALKPKKIYEEIGYKDSFGKAIVVLETNRHPPAKILERIANDCKIEQENLAVILTPTESLAGATQVAGRIVETGIHKLRRIGLNPNVICHAWGTAPIPPIHPNFNVAMARTNDAILYGGVAYYAVIHDDEEELKRILEKAPSNASKDYGRPFIEIFEDAKYDFYKIDPNLFAPAVVVVNNVKTGKIFCNGEVNAEALLKSFSF
ncbi:MAG: methenyltetrahydromethanopterin cyclohydrolase [Candidatus Bathyarchaeia archaeon]